MTTYITMKSLPEVGSNIFQFIVSNFLYIIVFIRILYDIFKWESHAALFPSLYLVYAMLSLGSMYILHVNDYLYKNSRSENLYNIDEKINTYHQTAKLFLSYTWCDMVDVLILLHPIIFKVNMFQYTIFQKYGACVCVLIAKFLVPKYNSPQLDFLSALYMLTSVYITYSVYYQTLTMQYYKNGVLAIVEDTTDITPAVEYWLEYVIQIMSYCDIGFNTEERTVPYTLPFAEWESLGECVQNTNLHYPTVYTKFYVCVTCDVIYKQYFAWYVFMGLRAGIHFFREKVLCLSDSRKQISELLFGNKQDKRCKKQSVYMCILCPNSALAHFYLWCSQSKEKRRKYARDSEPDS